MKRENIFAGIVIVVIILAGGAFLYLNNRPTAHPTGSSAAKVSTAPAATITYSGSGFSPATLTVHSGDTVAIKNTDSEDMQLASDPHPVHTDDTDLNAGVVAPGQTKTFVVTKKGSFGYHNHLDPSERGSITIE